MPGAAEIYKTQETGPQRNATPKHLCPEVQAELPPELSGKTCRVVTIEGSLLLKSSKLTQLWSPESPNKINS
jgi:hypothetical protein